MSKTAILYRKGLKHCSVGTFHVEDHVFHTIENPFIPISGSRGGKPFESCVPPGLYKLEPHSTEKFPDVWALVNHCNDVYHYPYQRKNENDRYACLIHIANHVRQVTGCIASGIGANYDPTSNNYMVTSSKVAITMLRKLLVGYDFLEIKQI